MAANYGLEECRFVRPIYHNDTIQVRLTCKEKVDRDSKGREFPSGVVKWYVEVFDQEGELVAIATILTMVQKKSPFLDFNKANVAKALDKLTENHTPKWGMLTPQHMVEHLEFFIQMAMGKVETEIITPEKRIERFKESLFNYRAMPRSFDHPLLKEKELEDLRFGNLAEAKASLLAAIDDYEIFFKENPGIETPNTIFGMLDKQLWDLMNRKHFHHHFSQFGLV